MNRFFIIVTGWNCEQYVERCVESIRNQTHTDWYAIFVNDCSTDNTGEVLDKCVPHKLPHNPRWGTGHTKKNIGAAAIRHEMITKAGLFLDMDRDIILLMGLDDELMPNALERINQEYEQGKLMTYGNWINQEGNGLPADFDLDFPDSVHADRSYRRVKYRSTAPNTFRRFLYDVIKPEDLQFNGEWYKATTESEVMFSCLEQCGKERIGVIKEPIYLYNQGREFNARKRFGIDYQTKIYNHVINKPKRELWSDSK